MTGRGRIDGFDGRHFSCHTGVGLAFHLDVGDGERETLALMRASDPRGFDRVYDRYRDRVYAFLLRLCGRRDVADDLFQDTWMRVAEKAAGLRPDSDVAAWLFTVARNVFRSAWRARRDVAPGPLAGAGVADFAPTLPAPGPAPDARLHLSELERALLALSVDDREVLLLIATEDLGQHQIAAIAGIAPAALRQRVTRARARLAKLLEPADTTPDKKAAP